MRLMLTMTSLWGRGPAAPKSKGAGWCTCTARHEKGREPYKHDGLVKLRHGGLSGYTAEETHAWKATLAAEIADFRGEHSGLRA